MKVISSTQFLQVAQQLDFFRDFSEKELKEVANCLSFVHVFNPDQHIVSEGMTDQALFLLLAGECRVTRSVNPNKVISLLSAGDAFGEMSLLTQRPRSANVISNSIVTVLRIDKKLLERVSPSVRERFKDCFIRILAERLERITQKIASLPNDF